MVCTDRRRRSPVFLLRIASIFGAAAEKLHTPFAAHVSMCSKNTRGPAGALLLANWTGNKNEALQSGHAFGFGPSSACPPSRPLIPTVSLLHSWRPRSISISAERPGKTY